MSTAELAANLGYAVFEARNAEEALLRLPTVRPDILLTDISLPGLSGIELARRAAQSVPGVRIIFASGDDSGIARADFPDAIVLSKPFQLEDLSRALSRAVEPRR